jgi:tetratricopeptide (TPR) repeat protein/tRNA A-37 threonylcarbamoyl transferase component Bud32
VPTAAADHNLLVGVLALQLDFVARDQLVEAACDVLRGPSTEPLIDVLRGRGILSSEECELLSALVARHLARHNNDPQQSLAHCDGAGEVRQLLTALGASVGNGSKPPGSAGNPASASAGTPDARSAETINVSGRLDPHATSGGESDPFLTTPLRKNKSSDARTVSSSAETMRYTEFAALQAAGAIPPTSIHAGTSGDAAPLSTPAAERFRIIRPFQRGGLGQVSLARDEELNREVALKEILPKHADSDEARQRFLMEAEITGSLEHPGVVPVYGLGQYGDGRPFYAMRLIRGDNLQLAIDEFHRQPEIADRELRFRQLLGRFVDVCDAIEYAHNRCVLHRDLKPGNIMLGKYGETLVVDWGLAKAVGSEAGPTDTVELPIRPASADHSTETQMGRIVGTPAYMSPEQALGRVDMLGPATDIYSLGATLYHLLVGRAPFGHEDRESLLGNVQMGRFPSPRSVKGDIPRQLESICLKAMARIPTDRYLTARQLAEDVERYLADEPVLAHPDTLYRRIARWMRKHRATVMGAGGILTVLAASLAVGLVMVNAANQRAEHNFEVARKAIRDYYVTVSEETLLNQPGMQPLRDQLLKQALDYYKEFIATSEKQDAAMLDEIAQANFYVGRITESIESPADAIPYYQTAVALNDQLVAQTPKSDKPLAEKRLAEQARALNALGGSLQRLQRYEESEEYYAQAEAVRSALVKDHPDNAEYVRTLANTMMNRGSVEAELGKPEAGVDRWEKAQALRTQHLSIGVADSKLRADAGKGDFNLGLHHLDSGDASTAEAHLLAAAEQFEQVRKSAPDDLASQYQLALAYRALGVLQGEAGEIDAAQAYYAKAFELLTTLNLRSPQVVDYKATLGAMQTSAAELLLSADQPDDALAAIEKAVGPLDELVDQNPDVLLYARDLAVALRVRAATMLKIENPTQAAADAQRAIDILTRLTAEDPADEDFKAQLDAARALQAEMKAAQTAPAESN